jgi:drug/metabolite transporter (DMT)-like permease
MDKPQYSPPAGFGATDIALLTMTVIWAVNAVVVKIAEIQLSLSSFLTLRLGLASLLFTIIIIILWKRNGPIAREDRLAFVFAGLTGTTGNQIGYVGGLEYTSASNASLILATTPVFVALINLALGREVLSPRGWLGILMTVAGVGIIVSNDLALTVPSMVGDLMVLGGTICFAAYTVITAELMKRYSPVMVSALSFVMGSIPLILACLPGLSAQDWSRVDARGWGGLIYSSILAIVVAYVIWNTGVHKIGGARTALYQNLKPVIAVIVAALVLGEAVRAVEVIGGVSILAGLHLARKAPHAAGWGALKRPVAQNTPADGGRP